MSEVADELLNLLLGLPLSQGLLLIETTLGLWIDDWLGVNRRSLASSLKKVPSTVEVYVKEYVQPQLNIGSSLRKENLSLVEYGYCMILAFHIRMDTLSETTIEEITNVLVADEIDEKEIKRRARILADHIYRIDLSEALIFFEKLVLSWAQRYDAGDLSQNVLKSQNYYLPENSQIEELSESWRERD